MREELVRFVDKMDRCWIEGRFDDLGSFLAADISWSLPAANGWKGSKRQPKL